jgi:hypothetical protein
MRPSNRSSIAALVVALAAITLSASVAFAKEGATVALTDPIPRDAEPGSTVTVEFTVMVPGENGPTPMIGSPVFVQLTAPDGATTRGFGTEDRGHPGTYRAEVTVPTGGIASAAFGLRGSYDIYFITQGTILTDATAPTGASSGTGAVDLALPVALGLAALLVAGLALTTRRRRLMGAATR